MRRIGLIAFGPFLILAIMLTGPVAAQASAPSHSPSSPRVQVSYQSSGLSTPGKRTASASMAACDEGFDPVLSPPTPSPLGSRLFATAVINANDVWAVGITNYSSTTPDQTLAEHWNGSAWSIVYTPNPSGFASDLNGVAAISSTDVWAVGSYQVDSTGNVHTFAEHWNGTSWSLFTNLPNPNPSFSALFAVTAVASNNVWAVGTWWSAGYFTLIEHWDGTTWNVVASPNQTFMLNFESNYLFAVSAYSATDVWAVGEWVLSGATSFDQSLAEHWDGTSWTIVSTPNLGGQTANNAIASVKALEPNHAVGVGFGNETSVAPKEGEAWDLLSSGTSTSSAETGPSPGDNVLEWVEKSGAAVWAVGYQRTSSVTAPQTLAIAATWNASSHTLTWGPVGTSANPSTNDVLFAASAISPYSFVAAGVQNTSNDQALIEAYCAFHFTVNGPAAATSGTPFSITVIVRDGAGTTQSGYRGTVHFTSNDPAATLPGDYTYTALDGGSHTFSATLRTSCAGTITASDLAMPLTMPGSVTVNVTPGACQAPGGTAGARAAGQTSGPAPAVSRAPAKPSTAGTSGQRIFRSSAAAATSNLPDSRDYPEISSKQTSVNRDYPSVSAPVAVATAASPQAAGVETDTLKISHPDGAATARTEARAGSSSRSGSLFVAAFPVIIVSLLLLGFVQRRRLHVRRQP